MTVSSRNLSLIPILRALLEQESVGGAARQVNLSQPAVSNALARLRKVLDDPLLVRVGRSMRLTSRAQQLRPQVDQLCAEIDRVFRPAVFSPATATSYFVIAAPDYLAFLLSRALLARLRDEAPGVRVRFVDVPVNLPDLLHDSTVDLAVCGNFHIWPNVVYQPLFQERFVAAVAHDHPLAARSAISSADLLEYPGVNIFTSATSSKLETPVLTGLPSLDWTPQITLGLFTDAVLLAVEPPIVARAPASLVEHLSAILPVTAVRLTGEEDEVDTGMFWAPMQHDDPEHVWLRGVVEEALAPLSTA